MIHVGFTGTRYGMTKPQLHNVRALLLAIRDGAKEDLCVHHGDCIGADAEFHDIASALHPPSFLVGHPPIDREHRAFKRFDREVEKLTHFARNRAIVAASTCMIAAPYDMTEQERGGTWYTIRYARRMGVPLVTVLPTGELLDRTLPQWPDSIASMIFDRSITR